MHEQLYLFLMKYINKGLYFKPRLTNHYGRLENGFWFIKVHSLDSIEWITAGTWSDKGISFDLRIGVQVIPDICKICGWELKRR